MKNFCKHYNVSEKSVLMTLNLNDCSTCYIPFEKLYKQIRKVNNTIPIYFITPDSLSSTESNLIYNKLGPQKNNIFFIPNHKFYDYLRLKNNGLASVFSISPSGNIITRNHLKYDNLDNLFKSISSKFKIICVKKAVLKNDIVSTRNCQTMLSVNKSHFAFYAGVNLICKYDAVGNRIKHKWIDSLKIDYLDIINEIFTIKQQKYSSSYYYKKQPSRKELIAPVNLMEYAKDTLCVTTTLLCMGDTIYPDSMLINKGMENLKGQTVTYQQRHTCLLLFDTSLIFLGIKHFSQNHEGVLINPHCNGANIGNNLFFGRTDINTNQSILSCYTKSNTVLKLMEQYTMPQKEQEMMMPSINKSNSSEVTIIYSTLNTKKMNITSTTLYSFNKFSSKFNKEFEINNLILPTVHKTAKGNYIYLYQIVNDIRVANEIKLEGYDMVNKKIVSPSKNKTINFSQLPSDFFIFEGYLWEYKYEE